MKKTLIAALCLILLIVSVSAVERTLFLDDYQIKYSYEDAEEGERFTLSVEMTNNGNNKTEVVLQLDDTGAFEIQGDDEWEIGTLEKNQKVSKTFRVEVDEETPEDEYDLDFTLEDSRKEYEDEFEIATVFKDAELIIADVKSEPAIISAGQDDIKLTIKVDNIGSADANSVVSRLNLPAGFSASSSYSNTANAGIIKAEGTSDLVFFIDTADNLKSGNHQASLSLQYKAETTLETKNMEFDLPVKGIPRFELVSYNTIPAQTPVDSEGKLNIRIKNIGEEEGEETSIRVFENADLPIEFDQKTNLIGSLRRGEEGTASFDLIIDEDAAPKGYIIKAQVRTVNKGNVLVDEFSVPITVVQPEKGSNYGLILGIALVILLAAIIYLIFLFRKRE